MCELSGNTHILKRLEDLTKRGFEVLSVAWVPQARGAQGRKEEERI
jgi:hypothetical protein